MVINQDYDIVWSIWKHIGVHDNFILSENREIVAISFEHIWLYGLGKRSLAERLNCSEEEAENIIQGLYKSFPKLREYVAIQQQYPLDHNGYINTMLGDKLRVQEYEWLLKSSSEREKKNLIARIQRLGVNLPIQGGTSSIMARGFMNNIRVSKTENWKNPLQPIIVVH